MTALSVVPFLIFVVWLGVLVYLVVLATRLVTAVERIAALLESRLPGRGQT